jgi:16S rRNA (uracil1498-N3)-methyltransferase
MTARFFCPPPLVAGAEIALPSSAAHHAARVLRLRVGDAVTVFDGEGGEYGAQIARVTPRAVSLRVLERRAIERESPLLITLVQALVSAERMDYAIQKAVELGAADVAPVATARSVTRLNGARAHRRVEHWRQIVIASCEQCGRNRLATVHAPCDLGEWLWRPSTATLRLLLAPGATQSLADFSAPVGPIELLVGPEGGLAPDEETAALDAGFRGVRMGPRILRTETAGAAMLAAMNAMWGDWR